jgi:hypothetical protein
MSDYKASKDIVRIEEGILKRRQISWKEASNFKKNNSLNAIFTFWDHHKGESWYVPPLRALEVLEETSIELDYKASNVVPDRFSQQKAWHFVLTELGYEDIDTSDPFMPYTDHISAYYCLISSLIRKGSTYSHIKESFMNGSLASHRQGEAALEFYTVPVLQGHVIRDEKPALTLPAYVQFLPHSYKS